MDKRRLLIGGLVCATGIGAVYWLAPEVHPFGLNSRMIEWRVNRILGAPLTLLKNTVLMPEFWAVIALTLTLERLLPAKPNQSWFGVTFMQDLVWFVYETILHTIIIVTYAQLLITIYHRNFEFLTIHAAKEWPSWVQFAVAVLLLDLMYWMQHYVNHKVPLLWSFHSVHHSQRELNFFTDFRYHVVEYVVRHTFLVIPFLVLAVEAQHPNESRPPALRARDAAVSSGPSFDRGPAQRYELRIAVQRMGPPVRHPVPALRRVSRHGYRGCGIPHGKKHPDQGSPGYAHCPDGISLPADPEEGHVGVKRLRQIHAARTARAAAASSRTPARITASELRAYPSNSMDESSVGSR